MKPPQKSEKKIPKPPARKKRTLLPPPPLLSEEVEELFQTSDFVELGYHQIEELRKLKERTPEQEQLLAEHDAIEQRMEADPRAVLTEAHQAIDHGADLLLTEVDPVEAA